MEFESFAEPFPADVLFQRFTYFTRADGKPDFGSVRMGPKEHQVVDIEISNLGNTLLETLHLENGWQIAGRKLVLKGKEEIGDFVPRL